MPEDTGYALAWQELQDGTCGGCGQPRDESMDPANDGAYAVTVLRCHACAEQAQTAQGFAEQGAGDRAGLFFSVTLDRPGQ